MLLKFSWILTRVAYRVLLINRTACTPTKVAKLGGHVWQAFLTSTAEKTKTRAENLSQSKGSKVRVQLERIYVITLNWQRNKLE